jgi:hypothetical protein
MADAIRKGDLETKRDALQAKLTGLGEKPVAADPQASIIASVIGWSEEAVVWALIAVIGFGLELVSCFGRFVLDRPAPRAPKSVDTSGQSDYGALADHPAMLTPNRPRRSAGRPDGGTPAIGPPHRPEPDSPVATVPAGRSDKDTKGRVLAFITTRSALGRPMPPQGEIAELFGVHKSTMSDWCAEWESNGSIEKRTQVGRFKIIVPAVGPAAKKKASA